MYQHTISDSIILTESNQKSKSAAEKNRRQAPGSPAADGDFAA
jgi:hypothetical protein